MEIQKSTLYGFALFIMIVGGGYFLLADGTAGPTGNVIGSPSGDVQEVVVGMKNYDYFPREVEVESGKTVRMRLDDSAYGCFRDLTIRDLGVRKYLKTADDYVEFTPTNPGTYTFACSMGMGSGKLIVK